MSLLAEPHASKVVHLNKKLVLKESDDDIELPSNFMKCGMYERWCKSHGLIAKIKDGRGSCGKLKDYAKVKPDSDRTKVCCISAFCGFWETFEKVRSVVMILALSAIYWKVN